MLDGRNIKFTYWSNPQIPLDGPYSFYFFSHYCEGPTLALIGANNSLLLTNYYFLYF